MSENNAIVETTDSNDFPGTYINIFNNEMIGSIAMYSVIKHLNGLSSAKAMLILPIAFHNQLISYISRANTDVKSIEQLLLRKPDLLANFNGRFYSLLGISINSLSILNALKCVKIDTTGIIKVIEEYKLISNKDIKLIGKRANNIINAAPIIAKLFDDEIENLYLQLRVKL